MNKVIKRILIIAIILISAIILIPKEEKAISIDLKDETQIRGYDNNNGYLVNVHYYIKDIISDPEASCSPIDKENGKSGPPRFIGAYILNNNSIFCIEGNQSLKNYEYRFCANPKIITEKDLHENNKPFFKGLIYILSLYGNDINRYNGDNRWVSGEWQADDVQKALWNYLYTHAQEAQDYLGINGENNSNKVEEYDKDNPPSYVKYLKEAEAYRDKNITIKELTLYIFETQYKNENDVWVNPDGQTLMIPKLIETEDIPEFSIKIAKKDEAGKSADNVSFIVASVESMIGLSQGNLIDSNTEKTGIKTNGKIGYITLIENPNQNNSVQYMETIEGYIKVKVTLKDDNTYEFEVAENTTGGKITLNTENTGTAQLWLDAINPIKPFSINVLKKDDKGNKRDITFDITYSNIKNSNKELLEEDTKNTGTDGFILEKLYLDDYKKKRQNKIG